MIRISIPNGDVSSYLKKWKSGENIELEQLFKDTYKRRRARGEKDQQLIKQSTQQV